MSARMPFLFTDHRGMKWKLFDARHKKRHGLDMPPPERLAQLEHIRANFMTVEDDMIDYAKAVAAEFHNEIQSPNELRMMAGADFLYAFSDDSKKHIFLRTKTGKFSPDTWALVCDGEFETVFDGGKVSFADLFVIYQLTRMSGG